MSALREVKDGGLCIGCGGGTRRQVRMLEGVWLFVCYHCDKPNSRLADRLRELRR